MDSKLSFVLFLVFTLTYVDCIGKCVLKDVCDATRHKNIASKDFVKKIPCVQSYAPTQLKFKDLELYRQLCPNLAEGMMIKSMLGPSH